MTPKDRVLTALQMMDTSGPYRITISSRNGDLDEPVVIEVAAPDRSHYRARYKDGSKVELIDYGERSYSLNDDGKWIASDIETQTLESANVSVDANQIHFITNVKQLPDVQINETLVWAYSYDEQTADGLVRVILWVDKTLGAPIHIQLDSETDREVYEIVYDRSITVHPPDPDHIVQQH